jgi:hypothetical protein
MGSFRSLLGGRFCVNPLTECALGSRQDTAHAGMVPRRGSEDFPMHKDAHLLDWAAAMAGANPTWLEIVASHAELLSISDIQNDGNSSRADEPRKWLRRMGADSPR